MSKAVRTAVDEVIAAMEERPNSFRLGDYRMRDEHSGLVYNIYMGVPSYGVESPYSLSFGWYHGWRFGNAVQRLKSYQTALLTREGSKRTA